MLTAAYVRVSTEDQAAEGFSIEGQIEKLKAYASLHDLGAVTVIEDVGWSGKNTERPGLQQLLKMVEQGHVSNVIVWRLDRLSRNLGDLILLADSFGTSNVALHSFCERIDLSSATGRMFYNVLGSFAQFYREQLSENVRMGMAPSCTRGQVDQPSEDGLRPDRRQPRTRTTWRPSFARIFRMRGRARARARSRKPPACEYSTVRSILHSRIYLGEVQLQR